mmetsp:Transcript_163651/g.524761  ORF Transcript_163651/g.524761 Transcript_163651/m.524761 type:complete len:242 (+) Transcript_163651:1704-2429(+)
MPWRCRQPHGRPARLPTWRPGRTLMMSWRSWVPSTKPSAEPPQGGAERPRGQGSAPETKRSSSRDPGIQTGSTSVPPLATEDLACSSSTSFPTAAWGLARMRWRSLAPAPAPAAAGTRWTRWSCQTCPSASGARCGGLSSDTTTERTGLREASGSRSKIRVGPATSRKGDTGPGTRRRSRGNGSPCEADRLGTRDESLARAVLVAVSGGVFEARRPTRFRQDPTGELRCCIITIVNMSLHI